MRSRFGVVTFGMRMLRLGIPWIVIGLLLLPVAALWLPGGAGDAGPPGMPAAPGTSGVPGMPPTPGTGIVWDALARSVLVAVLAATLSSVLGTGFALALAVRGLIARPLWGTALLIPLICPPTVWTLGQLYAWGTGGTVAAWLGEGGWRIWPGGVWPGVLATVAVLVQVHAPLAMLVMGRAVGDLGGRGWESARFYLGPLRRVGWFLGAVRRELASAWLLTFALALGNFAVPHVLQCRLYPIEIYARLTNYLDPAGAVWGALPLVLLTLAAAAGLGLCLQRTEADNVRTVQPAAPPASGWGLPAALFLGLYVLLTTGLTLAGLLGECSSPSRFLEAAREAAPETAQSLAVGLGAALLGAGLGTIVGGWVAARGELAAQVLALVPLGVPTLIVGLAYSRFFNQPGSLNLTWVGNTSLLVILGLAFRGFPFTTRIVSAGVRRLPAEWHQAARLSGMSAWRRWTWITVPLTCEFVLAGALLGFVLAVGDVEISQMLCAPGQGTLSLRLFTFLHFGPRHVAASLALLLLGISFVPVLVFFLVTNRYPRWF